MVSIPFNTPLILACALSLHGLRKRSLSPSGAAAAFFVGYTMLAVPLRTFGVALIIFYLAGSRATKVGKALKTKLEEGHQEAGYRNAAQVLCNSLSAAVAALLWSALYEANSWPSKLYEAANLSEVAAAPKLPYDFSQWCPLTPPPSASWSRPLLFVTLGHFACCLGDTLASELGILSRSPPILITTLKVVPPGTNGGLSKTGTLASLMGGLIMGITIAASLVVQSTACRSAWMSVVPPLLLWGTFAGGLGSLVDSLLGATLQQTRFLNSTKRILTDEAPEPAKDADVKVVSGYNLLTNNQVNLISSIATAVILGVLA
ncbi:Transmembrane protein 19 [Trametes pubescens]|uniref:Transmembrane protein 19 n=1 Tax=Trametes pubescens TaxID=154538 RepID=A0A1M2VLY1_TRAPU|nr:Transmembrane protein 19 [Trametes pubescens]